MKKSHVPAVAFSALLTFGIIFGACSLSLNGSGGTSLPDSDSSSSMSSEDGTSVQTPNVSYSGVLDELGASVYMEGTHKLTLDDGQMIVLQSTDDNLDLGKYIGKHVEVQGSVQPTVEAGGTMMRVSEITVLESSSASSEVSSVSSETSSASSAPQKKFCGGIAGFQCDQGEVCVDDPSDSCDPEHGGADCGGMCVTILGSSSSAPVSSAAAVSSSASSTVVSSSEKSAVSSSASEASSTPADEDQIQLMMKQTYDQASLWTQKYCTSHIAFCIPVHKNWYFKSFGATTTNAWHVEFGMVAIDELGQGAIALNLVSGTSASMNARDGQIKEQGSEIIAFKDWNDGDHFEIIADKRLRAAVEYMISHITAYELAQ